MKDGFLLILVPTSPAEVIRDEAKSSGMLAYKTVSSENTFNQLGTMFIVQPKPDLSRDVTR